MKINIKIQLLFTFLFICSLASAQTRNRAYLAYIEQYYQLAEKQQKEHGIPASIILAQGLLESGAGQSSFAKESNNHFGIKCTDWTGQKIYRDDDEKGECFRKYDQVTDSYEDHANFLKTRPRYSFLFNLKPTDYEGWAYGLKKAGYATDPTYAYKLISIIETYDLHRFDLEVAATVQNFSDNNASNKTENNESGGSIGSIKAVVNHQIYKVNGVKFVTSVFGDSYAAIADEFRMSEDRLRTYNDISSTQELNPGTRVFISYKKNKAPKNSETHDVQEGESMHSIAQDYAIKIVCLYKMNNMDYSAGAKLGQILKLR